jgi:hypothetical protein
LGQERVGERSGRHRSRRRYLPVGQPQIVPTDSALEDGDLRGYAAQLGLDVALLDRDRASVAVLERIQRDVDSGLASGQVLGTPALFIDGVVPPRRLRLARPGGGAGAMKVIRSQGAR